MNLLIQSVRIVNPNSGLQDNKVDIYIENGIYHTIADSISPTTCKNGTEIFNASGNFISIGWFDMHVNFREPGFEKKENILSGQRAAAAGGLTGVAIMPSVFPVLQTRADIEFVMSKSKGNITDIYPIGALTVNSEGKELTEMYDMKLGGAVAFTDDKRSIQNSGVMMRAMQYVDQIDSRLIVYCDDEGLTGETSANESLNTLLLGLKGSPAIAEEIAIERHLSLCRYTGTSMHFTGVSTKEGIDKIREAKKNGMPITCEVAVHHLVLTDESLEEFDTNYKVKPPLRSKEDVAELRIALADGIIDVITSDHSPEDKESKQVEWDFAAYGIIGLESLFGLICPLLSDKFPLSKLIEMITSNPRKIMGLKNPEIKVGEKADFTIFKTDLDWIFKASNIRSLSSNSPFIGKKMKGKAIAIGNNNLFQLID